MTDYSTFQRERYFPALDGLRAVSILLVLTWHVDEHRWSYLSGYTGVVIFFVLSGFLIHTLLLREEDRTGSVSLKAFYLRRTFRILPLYFLVVGCYLALLRLPMLARQATAFYAALPYYLTALNDFAPSAPFNQSWSLGVEEKFYLVWPALAFVVLVSRKHWRIAVMAVLAVVPPLLATNGHFGFLPPYSIIMVGCTVAACLDDSRMYAAHSRFASGAGYVLTPILFLLFHALLGMYPDRTRPLYGYLLFGYSLSIGLLLVWCVTAGSLVHRILSAKWVRHIGQRSYGMYLVHLICLSFLQRVLRPTTGLRTWLLLFATILMSLAVAEMLYRLVEHPCIAFGRRLQERWLMNRKPQEIASPALK